MLLLMKDFNAMSWPGNWMYDGNGNVVAVGICTALGPLCYEGGVRKSLELGKVDTHGPRAIRNV